MTGLNARAIRGALVSHAASLGVFDVVNTHEPIKNAPGNGITCSVWLAAVDPARIRSGLAVTSARLVFTARLATAALQLDPDEIDMRLLDALDVLMTAFGADFTLGDLGQLDLLGSVGIPLQAIAGYAVQDGKEFRIFNVNIPVLVNDVWPQTP